MSEQARKRRLNAPALDHLVHQIIQQSDRAISAYGIVSVSEAMGQRLIPMQVYRSLNRLIAERKIERLATLNAYVLSTNEQSLHLICSGCGSQASYGAEDVHALLSTLCQSRGFQSTTCHLEISGACSHC